MAGIDFAAFFRSLSRYFGAPSTPPPPPTPLTRDVEVMVPAGAAGTLRFDDGTTFQAVAAETGKMTFTIPYAASGGADLIVTADGCDPWLQHVALESVLHAPVFLTPIRHRQAFSRDQLVDIQCDLMIPCQGLGVAPNPNDQGVDDELQIHLNGDIGRAHGIEAGWVWCTTIGNYPPEKRQIIYRRAKELGHTHFALHVSRMGPGTGYHGVFPMTQEMGDNYGQTMNTVHRELIEQFGMVPVCFGVSPDNPPAPGFDCNQVLVAATDWDNTAQAASRIRAISDAFPHAWLFWEQPADNIWPDASPDDPVAPNEGSSNPWIRGIRQRFDRFVGVIHEAQIGQSVDDVVALYTRKHSWWHDLSENQGEVDTFDKFWNNMSYETARQRNDAIAARCPWLKGTMSGWTMRPAPPSEPDHPDSLPLTGDMIDPATIIAVGGKPFLSWPPTARITKLALTTTGIYVEFSTKETWSDVTPPGWAGPIRYSLGVVLNINGQWFAGAPIECWWTDSYYEFGGSIQDRNIDGSGIGQIAKNWFYNHNIPPVYQWGQMAGYQPAENEEIGFFIVAGSVRNSTYAAFERSAIVKFAIPPSGVARTFSWA